MTALDTIARIREAGLDRRLGYKLKDGRMHDTAIFRWESGRWRDVLNPAMLLSELDVLTLLSHGAANGKEVFAFGCCCFKCATPDAQAAAAEFHTKTGLYVSHGWWPGECSDEMMDYYRRTA